MAEKVGPDPTRALLRHSLSRRSRLPVPALLRSIWQGRPGSHGLAPGSKPGGATALPSSQQSMWRRAGAVEAQAPSTLGLLPLSRRCPGLPGSLSRVMAEGGKHSKPMHTRRTIGFQDRVRTLPDSPSLIGGSGRLRTGMPTRVGSCLAGRRVCQFPHASVTGLRGTLRSCGLLSPRQALCQAELHGGNLVRLATLEVAPCPRPKRGALPLGRQPALAGRRGWIRTSGLLVPNEAECQAVLHAEVVVGPVEVESTPGGLKVRCAACYATAQSSCWWCPAEESNLAPLAYRASVPPTELAGHVLELRLGLEPSCLAYKASPAPSRVAQRREGNRFGVTGGSRNRTCPVHSRALFRLRYGHTEEVS